MIAEPGLLCRAGKKIKMWKRKRAEGALLCVAGYANEVGESFRALVPVSVVWASYGVATAYVTADAVDKGKKAAGAVSMKAGGFTSGWLWTFSLGQENNVDRCFPAKFKTCGLQLPELG